MNITTEFELQPVGTSPLAINVRGIEPGTQRNRGGARPGVSRYVNDRPGGLTSLIQHLNIIVDPTVDATLAVQDDITGTVIDPSDGDRNRGRYIRKGGSGIQPKRGVPRNPPTAVDDFAECTVGDVSVDIIPIVNDTYLGVPTIVLGVPSPSLLGGTIGTTGSGLTFTVTYTPPSSGNGGLIVIPYTLTSIGNQGKSKANINITVNPSGIAFVQASLLGDFGTFPGQTTPRSVSYPSATGNGNLLVVVVAAFCISTNPSLTVVNAIGQPYTQVGTYVPFQDGNPTAKSKLSMWYRVASDGVNENTVTVTPDANCYLTIRLLEWSGTNASAPFDGTVSNHQDYTGAVFTSWSTGAIPLSVPTGLMIAAFMTHQRTFDAGSQPTYSAGVDNLRASRLGSNAPNPEGVGACNIFVVSSESQTLSVDPTTTQGGSYIGFAAIGASFKP